MLIEDMRSTHIGEIALLYKTGKIEMPSYFYVETAFLLSLESIAFFENPYDINSIRYHRKNNYNAIIQWFLCLESYITSFAKLISLKDATIDFNSLKTKDLSGRLNSVLKGYDLEKYRTEYVEYYALLNEFCTFRNELFHDRFFQSKRHYDKTLFSEIATDLNIVAVKRNMLEYIYIFLNFHFL